MIDALAWLCACLAYGLLAALWCRVSPRLSGRLKDRLLWSSLLGFAAALGPALARYQGVFFGHAEDSLFTLPAWQQGLVILLTLVLAVASLQLALSCALLLRRLAGSRPVTRVIALVGNLALLLLLFASLLPLVPQLFYQLYRALFLGLPQQWVVASPLDWSPFWHGIALAPGSSLSQVAVGLTFWSLVLPSLLMHVCPPKQGS